MPAMITAVPPDPGSGPPGPGSMTERTLQDFAASFQNGAMFGMPQLANPAALASELFSNLRGYFERAQNFDRLVRSLHRTQGNEGTEAGGDRANVVVASLSDGPRTDLHGGPARESFEPGSSDGDVSSTVRTRLADFERFADTLLESMEFGNETTLIGEEVLSFTRSVNTLFRGQ